MHVSKKLEGWDLSFMNVARRSCELCALARLMRKAEEMLSVTQMILYYGGMTLHQKSQPPTSPRNRSKAGFSRVPG